MCEKAGPVVRPFVFLTFICHPMRHRSPDSLSFHADRFGRPETALDALWSRLTLVHMKLRRLYPEIPLTENRTMLSIGFLTTLLGCTFILQPTAKVHAAEVGKTDSPVLEFLEPTNNAIFSTLDEIPIVLSAFAPDDVFTSAEVIANHHPIATVQYCCAFCPCPPPGEGLTTILQIPVPWEGGELPPRIWQGWTNVHAGTHRLTAHGVGQNGTIVEAAPVTITVLDLTLHIFVATDGAATLVIPQGSLVEGGYDLEASPDLRTWTRLGSFQPGNVAAFYYDDAPTNARPRQFYRSVYVPLPQPPRQTPPHE